MFFLVLENMKCDAGSNIVTMEALTSSNFSISMVSCQKGPTRHAYAWQIGPFWQDILDMKAVLLPGTFCC